MTRFQKKVARITSIIGAIGFFVWYCFEPTFEPAIGFILIIGGIIRSYTISSKYKKKRLKGSAKFNYSNNNGIYEIGEKELFFEISGIALADNNYQINEIKDAGVFDFSSRSRTIPKHGIAILKNKYGNYAVIKILDIKDNTRGDIQDELIFQYVINPDRRTDFS